MRRFKKASVNINPIYLKIGLRAKDCCLRLSYTSDRMKKALASSALLLKWSTRFWMTWDRPLTGCKASKTSRSRPTLTRTPCRSGLWVRSCQSATTCTHSHSSTSMERHPQTVASSWNSLPRPSQSATLSARYISSTQQAMYLMARSSFKLSPMIRLTRCRALPSGIRASGLKVQMSAWALCLPSSRGRLS